MITLHLVTEYVTFCRVRFKVLSISTIFDTLKPLNHHGIIMHNYELQNPRLIISDKVD